MLVLVYGKTLCYAEIKCNYKHYCLMPQQLAVSIGIVIKYRRLSNGNDRSDHTGQHYDEDEMTSSGWSDHTGQHYDGEMTINDNW